MADKCSDHSGFEARVEMVKERLDENIANQRRIHERIDELGERMDTKFDEFSNKLHQYSDQISSHFEQSMTLFTHPKDGVILGENGIKAQTEANTRNIGMAWKVICFVFGPPLLALIGYFFKRLFAAM
jgi:predicted nuclease with TOPRIM domain